VESVGRDIGAPMAWPGGTSLRQVIADLGNNVGWSPPWFDHLGVCRVMRIVEPSTSAPDIVYTDTMYSDSPVIVNDLLHAVNRTIAISSDSADQAYVGIYDVPSSAPYSYYARGFRVVEVFNVQGIGSQSQINATARTMALSTGPHRPLPPAVEHLAFQSAPDPRHDGYTVVDAFGQNWVEESWTLTLSPVGPMEHMCRSAPPDVLQ
jgi:hypothetical protein